MITYVIAHNEVSHFKVGISYFQAVIACVSPKYVVSHHCTKELTLADLLHKPIIPVMIDKVAWPPPGGMSLIFSQLVYVNMKGKYVFLMIREKF